MKKFKVVDGHFNWNEADEHEKVIPTVWVKGNKLYWPERHNEASYMKICKSPIQTNGVNFCSSAINSKITIN